MIHTWQCKSTGNGTGVTGGYEKSRHGFTVTGTWETGACNECRSGFLEVFKVVCVEFRTQARGLAEKLGDMPLMFGGVVF